MPFSTNVNWPQGLLDIFHISHNRNAPLESCYYGPYDWLFNYAVIEGSFTFFLALQTAPDENSLCDGICFVAFLTIPISDMDSSISKVSKTVFFFFWL